MAKNKNRYLLKIGNTWYFRIKWQGQVLKRSLGASKEAFARDLRDEYLANLIKYGKLDPPVDSIEEYTFGEMSKKWALIHREQVKYSTWRDYRSIMNSCLLPHFKDRPIKDISYMEILKFRNSLAVSPKRKNNIMIPMKSVFDMAFQEGIIAENVMRKIKRVREERPDIKPFSYAEIKMILEAVDPWYRSYIEAGFFTGMRAGELSGLKWSDYHPNMPNGPELHLRRAYVYGKDGPLKTKGSARNIECEPEVVEALKRQYQLTGDTEYIFLTKEGNRMDTDHIRNVVWKPALQKAGLDYRPPIQIRHTFATMMLSSGEDVGWVQNMLGHSSPQMIYQRYYSWIPNRTRANGSAFRRFVEQYEQENENVDGKKDAHEKPEMEATRENRCTNIVPIDAFRKKKKNRQKYKCL
jgi:integrase